MARIAAVSPALPAFVYSQAEITDTIVPMVTSDPGKQAVMRRLHGGSMVATRHLVMPIERYRDATTFTRSNEMSPSGPSATRSTRPASFRRTSTT
jgi:alkylresorcinol/alkylpyrone synthase